METLLKDLYFANYGAAPPISRSYNEYYRIFRAPNHNSTKSRLIQATLLSSSLAFFEVCLASLTGTNLPPVDSPGYRTDPH